MPTQRQLRYFVAVGQELHFGRAALKLSISQPPLSQQIMALEDEIGVQLLRRLGRRVELTPAGLVFLTHARDVLARTADAVRATQLADSGVTQAEYDLALGNITGGLALRYESSIARMNRLLSAEIGTGEYLSVSEVMERFRSVTLSDVQQIAQRIITAPSSLIAVGEGLEQLQELA